jgi:cyclohexadieny/prephenate dehydrogenase
MADRHTSLFGRVAIVGIGLIGSSLARAIARAGLAGEIAIADRDAAALARAEALGLGTSYHATAVGAATGADLVIACVPVGACGSVAAEIAPVLSATAIVSDVGSVKGSVIRQMAPLLPNPRRLVPAHPVAGTEQSGPDAGFAELFDNRWCILTPSDDADADAVDKVAALWRACGANVEVMASDHHDLVLAITSHLPHLIAYNIVGTAADLEEVTQSEVIKFSAGGFRDFTRIAASDPTMWRDVFLHNKDAVLEVLGRFSEDLAALQRAIRWGDGDQLFDVFTRTRAIRRGIVAAGQDTASPDFGRRPGDAAGGAPASSAGGAAPTERKAS